MSLTPPGRNPQEPEGQQHADVQQHHGDEGQPAQDVVVGEEDEGLGEAEAGRQAVLQGEVLLAHRRATGRVLRTERKPPLSPPWVSVLSGCGGGVTDLHFDLDGVQPGEVEGRIPRQDVQRSSGEAPLAKEFAVDADVHGGDRGL